MIENGTTPDNPLISRLPVAASLPWKRRYEIGRSRRNIVPLAAHAEWSPSPGRDTLALLEASNEGRLEKVVPLRYERMLSSSFSLYRGTPEVMAYDLAHTPNSGIIVQLCGDCHISNFGMFASPERKLVFDLNDFDETLPGPFEWDVKRAAASIVIAARNAGLSEKDARKSVLKALRLYRQTMNEFATRSYLEIWYSQVRADSMVAGIKKKRRKVVSAQLAKAQDRDRLRAFTKLTEVVDLERRIIHDPPLIYRFDVEEESIRGAIKALFAAYYESVDDSLRHLLSRYRFVDLAHKVVGIGSVGTRCYISLWIGIDEGDPLFLQVKQARPSLLEPYLGRSEYDHPGQRIVTGQRLMQANNDIFLGYGQVGAESYFIRQLYDMKGAIDLENISAFYLKRYAGLCGTVLARAHARTGDAARIAGYLGGSDHFDHALVEFAFRYADQNEMDWQAFEPAIKSGRLRAGG